MAACIVSECGVHTVPASVVLYRRKWYLPSVIDLSKEDRIAKHKDFLGSNWDVLAAVAIMS